MGGRFVVEDRSSAALGAMVAYAATLALRERRDVYVREIGQQRALYRAAYDGGSVTIINVGGSNVRA